MHIKISNFCFFKLDFFACLSQIAEIRGRVEVWGAVVLTTTVGVETAGEKSASIWF